MWTIVVLRKNDRVLQMTAVVVWFEDVFQFPWKKILKHDFVYNYRPAGTESASYLLGFKFSERRMQ